MATLDDTAYTAEKGPSRELSLALNLENLSPRKMRQAFYSATSRLAKG